MASLFLLSLSNGSTTPRGGGEGVTAMQGIAITQTMFCGKEFVVKKRQSDNFPVILVK